MRFEIFREEQSASWRTMRKTVGLSHVDDKERK